MTWTWRFEDADGKTVEAQETDFTSQGDAESWLGEEWRALSEGGASTAILSEDDTVEYRMSLAPEDS
ncbi:MAG TPA: hypothetical protein VE172_20340 [Stackebrandtia sp.]|jgi:hypothetical protein|uniref:hypothetical protein n=1 Tax=Stackebrandtia sp. TaxID=2023065 RepID=UPI002D23E5A4|nr:hypothetical protein [Stackebrandtia sp.]HZE41156.1 hypothetical protein [Stackebrandtia sp.]